MSGPTLIDLGEIGVKATEGKLYTCRTIWPFFYTRLDLTETELTITTVEGIYRDIKKIQIPNLSSVESGHALSFGHVKIYSKYMTTGEITVKWLRARDAISFTKKVNALMTEVQAGDTSGGQ